MTSHLKLLIVFLLAALSALAVLASSSAEGAKESEAAELLNPASFSYYRVVQSEKTTDQAYRNIQVFKGVPASQLLGAMNFMAGALGVSCNHCHTQNQFAKDDKPANLLGQLPEATDYGDYKRVNGFMFPFSIRLSRPPLTAIQKFTEIKLDGPISDELFDMPPAK